jgi:hypothetical protein
MSNFKTTFRFYDMAAPFPGQCVFSGQTTNLWEVGSMVIQGTPVPVLLADRVLVELADSAGFVSKEEHERIVKEQAELIAKQTAQLEAAPQLLKELISDVNNTLTDFVTTLAGVASGSVSNGSEGSEANTGSTEAKSGPAAKAGQGKKQSVKPSTEPAGE